MTEPEDTLRQAERQLEVHDALARAAERRTEVVALLGEAVDAETGVRLLQELLGIGEIPARAVIDLQLRRLTRLDRERIATRCAELRAEIERLR